MSFTDLSQKLVDSYNEHPALYTTKVVAAAALVFVATRRAAKCMAKEDPTLRSGMYA